MVSCSDTPARPDQTSLRGWIWAALALLWPLSQLVPAPARAQLLCPAAAQSDDAVALQGLGAVQVRREGLPVLWASEAVCGRAELGKHWGSLRVGHAFGQANDPADPGREGVQQSARLLPEYRFYLKPVADSGALRLAARAQYEHDPLRGTDHRLQGALGPHLDVVDDYRWRFGMGVAYYLEAARPTAAPGDGRADFERRSGAWLSAAIGFSPHEDVLFSQELLVQLALEGDSRFEPRGYLQSTFRVHGSAHWAVEAALLLALDTGLPARLDRWDAVLRSGVVFTF